MFTTKFAGLTPVLLLAMSVTGFAGWIAYDCAKKPSPPPAVAQAAPELNSPVPPPRIPTDVLIGGFRPGLPREIVEEQLHRHSDAIPVPSEASSDPLLRFQYRVHLERPLPHLMSKQQMQTFHPGDYLLTLEFDGRLPDQPLSYVLLTPAPAK